MFKYKDRYIRFLPGRLRTEMHGLQDNKQLADSITAQLLQMTGIKQTQACTITGRLTVNFDPNLIHVDQICKLIQKEELRISSHIASDEEVSLTHCPPVSYVEEVAVTKDTLNQNPPLLSTESIEVPETFQKVPTKTKETGFTKPIPLGLGLTLGGLTFLGAKQLLFGRSSIASSSMLFTMSGVLSVMTGYPFFRRGFQQFNHNRKWNSDLILGTAAIGLGLIRENLLSLAGLSILQYIHWKRTQLEQNEQSVEEMEEHYLSPSIRKYCNKVGKWALPLAGITWAVTKDPLRGLAVLIALNPRLVIQPTISAWKQAEIEAVQKEGWIPKNGSLSHLSRTNTLLVEDTSLLFKSTSSDLQLLTEDSDEEDRIWSLTASLLAKSNHPWKNIIQERADESKRTPRTAFHVVEERNGVHGEIHQSIYYFGNLAYMQQHKLSVDPHLFKLKRMEKNRTEAYCLVRKTDAESHCLGVIFLEKQSPYQPFLSVRKRLEQADLTIAVLNNRLQIEPQVLANYNLCNDWLSMSDSMQKRRINQLREQGQEVLLIKSDQNHGFTTLADSLPHISINQIKDLPQMMEIAKQVDRQIQRQFQATKFFHLFGTVLAIPFRVSAMMINLIQDALSLFFLSRINRNSLTTLKAKLTNIKAKLTNQSAIAETAATADTATETPLWYTMPPPEVTAHFCVEEQQGLTDVQVQALKHQFGFNQLDSQQSQPWWKSYLGQFKEFTTLLLLGTTLLSFFTGDIFNGICMSIVLMANAAVGTVQERKAEKVVEALNQYQAPQSKVIRNSEEQVISGKDLLPGDIVVLEAGDRIPADIRLIQCWNLEIDESMLTGESVPVTKSTNIVSTDCPLTERINMGYKGTSISRGRAIGIVVATGMNTEMGNLIHLMKDCKTEVTPLQKEVSSISKTFIKGALAIALLIFGVGLIRGNSLMQMIPTSIVLAASAIPEGLPVTVTVALSAGILRMAKKSTLIRKLSSLETLGRVTVICTDKTGTLTKNEMTVRSVATIGNVWNVTGEGYNPNGTLISEQANTDGHQKDLQQLVKIASLCNNTVLMEKEGQWTINGDPTEGALLVFAHKTGVQLDELKHWNREHEVPFDSSTGKMSVVCRDPDSKQSEKSCYQLIKGSIESILNHCQFVQQEGNIVPFTDEHKRQILAQNEEWAKKSMRVLAFAYHPIDWNGNEDVIENNSIFIGMVGMMDPPKPEVEKYIREAHRLGVRPVMITGDHPMTAIAIAKEVGIHSEPVVMTGQELDHHRNEDLLKKIEQVSVFARVTPEHKLRIVQAYQQLGHKVAMTGDGVNDTPAVKQADVGIAMGQTGTEVTKESADMVLESDHFGSIVDGVIEGRTIVSNIRKALGCLLTGNLAEILVTGVSVLAGMPIPLIPIQILVMNLLTDALPAMVLAMNPGNKTKQTNRGKIADKDLYSKVIIRGTMLGLGALGLFAATLASGASLPIAQTIAFATLVCGQLMQIFSWRLEGSSEKINEWIKDRFFMGAVGISALALLSIIYVPACSAIFLTAPLQAIHWLKIVLVAGSLTALSKPIYWLLNRKQQTKPVYSFQPLAFANE